MHIPTGWSVMNITTCSVQGAAAVQLAFEGIVTMNVLVPLCVVVVDVEPAGKPSLSARTGWVVDQTGFP